MSHPNDTSAALSKISDPGFFEMLATSVLRRAEPTLYANLTQPGVNADGKTIRAPIDALSFVIDSDPPHMVSVHHTTAKQSELRNKWLLGPRINLSGIGVLFRPRPKSIRRL